MVLEIVVEGKRFYACGECGLIYEASSDASRCEKWCKEHRSCNLAIAEKSIGHARRRTLRLT